MFRLNARRGRRAIVAGVLLIGCGATVYAQPMHLPSLGMPGSMPSAQVRSGAAKTGGNPYDAEYAQLSANLKRKSQHTLEVGRTIWDMQLSTTEKGVLSAKEWLKDLHDEPKESTQAVWMMKSLMTDSKKQEEDPEAQTMMTQARAEEKAFLARYTGPDDPKLLAFLIDEGEARLKDAEYLLASLKKHRP